MFAGFALITLLAHPAGAASPPVPVVPVSSIPVVGTPASAPVAALVTPVTTSVTNTLSGVAPVVAPTVASVIPAPVRALGAQVIQIVTNAASGSGIVVPAITEGNGAPTVPSSASPTAIGRTVGIRLHAQVSPTAGGRRPLSDTTGRIAAVPHQGQMPVGPVRAPAWPNPSPISPVTAAGPSDFSAPSQGTSPFGSLPPSSLLLPALALGGVLLVRGKRPQLLLVARCSPPG